MMTIDDEGEGVFWPMMTSSQEPHFLVNFWDFSKSFSKIFLKVYKSGQKISTFRGNFYLNYFDSIT